MTRENRPRSMPFSFPRVHLDARFAVLCIVVKVWLVGERHIYRPGHQRNEHGRTQKNVKQWREVVYVWKNRPAVLQISRLSCREMSVQNLRKFRYARQNQRTVAKDANLKASLSSPSVRRRRLFLQNIPRFICAHVFSRNLPQTGGHFFFWLKLCYDVESLRTFLLAQLSV